jgi:transposase-like protein
MEASAAVRADRHERSEERANYCNGYRPRTHTTQPGDLELPIPKLCSGGMLLSILKPRCRLSLPLKQLLIHQLPESASARLERSQPPSSQP